MRGEDVQVEVKGPGSNLDTRQRTIGDVAHIEFEPQHMGMHQVVEVSLPLRFSSCLVLFSSLFKGKSRDRSGLEIFSILRWTDS